MKTYPHYTAEVWGGRLPTPPEYRGTPIAEMFKDGRLGGKTITESREFEDTPQGRAQLVAFVQDHSVVEVCRVRSQRHPKQRVPSRELLATEFLISGKIR